MPCANKTEDPSEAKKRGHKSVVRREVVRLVTPGTLTEDNLLDAHTDNLIVCLAVTPTGNYALAWADISVGSFEVSAIESERLGAELCALRPREIIINENIYGQNTAITEALQECRASITPLETKSI